MSVVVNTVKVALSGAIPAGSNVIGGVTQSGSWSVSVSGTPSVSVSNASIAVTQSGSWTVAATQSGTWDIGSITTLPALPTGTNTIGAVTQSGTWTVEAPVGGLQVYTATVGDSTSTYTKGVPALVADSFGAWSPPQITSNNDLKVEVRGTTYDGAAFTAGDPGVAMMGVDDLNDEWRPIEVSNSGELKTNVMNTVDVAVTGGVTVSTAPGSPVEITDGGATISIDDGSGSITVDGTVAISNASIPVTDNGGSLTVDGTVAATQSGTWNIGSVTTLPSLVAGSATIGSIASITTGITPGTGATDLGKAEDSVHSSGDVGVAVWGVRNDNAATAGTGANGEYASLSVDASGVLFTKSPHRPTPYDLISTNSTNATSVSATANTVLYGYYISNTNSSFRYVKFYNKASAPTVGTDTPVLVLAIPGSGAANVSFPAGINFTTGLAFATTTGAADSDTGAVAANEIIVNLVYATY